jgi:hypothetical protein
MSNQAGGPSPARGAPLSRWASDARANDPHVCGTVKEKGRVSMEGRSFHRLNMALPRPEDERYRSVRIPVANHPRVELPAAADDRRFTGCRDRHRAGAN